MLKKGEYIGYDIGQVRANELPRADIWCFGFPCQDISIAGKQKGVRKGTRSGLFYKVIELLQEIKEEDKPSYLFIENVKNLLSINGGWDFGRILFEMDERVMRDVLSKKLVPKQGKGVHYRILFETDTEKYFRNKRAN